MTLRALQSPDAPPAATYAQAVELTSFSRLVFVSGQIPARPDGTVPAGFADQARLAWANVAAQLNAADMTMDHLVKVTIYLSDRRHIDDYRATRDAALGGRKVALTTIITGIFDPAWLLEIEAVAAPGEVVGEGNGIGLGGVEGLAADADVAGVVIGPDGVGRARDGHADAGGVLE